MQGNRTDSYSDSWCPRAMQVRGWKSTDACGRKVWEQNHPFGGSRQLHWIDYTRKSFVTLKATECMREVSMNSSTFRSSHTLHSGWCLHWRLYGNNFSGNKFEVKFAFGLCVFVYKKKNKQSEKLATKPTVQ